MWLRQLPERCLRWQGHAGAAGPAAEWPQAQPALHGPRHGPQGEGQATRGQALAAQSCQQECLQQYCKALHQVNDLAKCFDPPLVFSLCIQNMSGLEVR